MKKNWKKMLVLGLSLTLASGMMTGCGKEKSEYTIGICQSVQHPALDQATQGFQDALTELLGDKVSFEVENAQGDSATCGTIINSFVSADVDLILANA